ncbi:hypothetical protein CANCADRAFT_4419 [Tortispora caseinolytica NRRL Y-17796]|uniref:ethanolamine-phosphate cytidylyltransferase n=1 Tax=Tortispora caseinolytica NRRL Y-17796 TaxID=767744 RepID=A0A1E4TDL5_9ASCO|nr:hypothetical protein CANCADRAFT_4419 [Tortispora caseinolytica NRRL Y-17796]
MAEPIQKNTDRIWVDGCFDFTHHGHAGAMLQARQLGKALVVGVHSDEDIALNKGPVVMRLDERMKAVEACRWVTEAVPNAPYVTDPAWMDKYGCYYAVHGDDITTDASGQDAYRVVKNLHRFLLVKRTEGISTTGLVQRLLDGSRDHYVQNIDSIMSAVPWFERYASAADGRSPLVQVDLNLSQTGFELRNLVKGDLPTYPNGCIYLDGSWDLFHTGQIEFLRRVGEIAQQSQKGVIVGIFSDADCEPVMNLIERGLCVMQCRYVSRVILNVPLYATDAMSAQIGANEVYHGARPVEPINRYSRLSCPVNQIDHDYRDMSTETIIDRVRSNRLQYEERQKRKNAKAAVEAALGQTA